MRFLPAIFSISFGEKVLMGKIKWYLVEDVSPAIELTEKTLKEQCRNGLYSYKVVKKNNKTNYYINQKSCLMKL